MTLDNKVFWGGLVALAVCLAMVWLGLATDNTVLIVIYTWITWLAFHNRMTKTIAISAVLGLLASVCFGVFPGLLLFGILMVVFWYAWI